MTNLTSHLSTRDQMAEGSFDLSSNNGSADRVSEEPYQATEGQSPFQTKKEPKTSDQNEMEDVVSQRNESRQFRRPFFHSEPPDTRMVRRRCHFCGTMNVNEASSPVRRNKTRRWIIPGKVGGIQVNALPDTGAERDVLSLGFARRHRLTIIKDGDFFTLPNGKRLKPLGTVTLPFCFAGDTELHTRKFYVIKGAADDVILGNPFLKETETLTRFFNDRVQETKHHSAKRPSRLCLLGSTSQVLDGRLNGQPVSAIPDTGSDVNIISGQFAETLGLDILTDPSYRSELMLHDGTVIYTDGAVINAEWIYADGNTEKRSSIGCDLHVVNQLNCDLIFGNEFLFDTGAYENYRQSFRDISEKRKSDNPNTRTLYVIKYKGDMSARVERILRGLRLGSRKENGSRQSSQSTLQEEYELEMARHGQEEDRIMSLEPDIYDRAREAETRRHKQWLETYWQRHEALRQQ